MSAGKHTPGPWRVCAGDPTYVSVPEVVKPINAGSRERAARIVQCVNAHDELVGEIDLILNGTRLDEFNRSDDALADTIARMPPGPQRDLLQRLDARLRAAIAKATGSAR